MVGLCALPLLVATATASLSPPGTSTTTAKLDALADSIFAWRSSTQPISADDLPRCAVDPRPAGWAPNVTAAALLQRELDYEAFVRELSALRGSTFPAWDRDDQAGLCFVQSCRPRSRK